MEKSESTNTLEWTLAKGDENNVFREHGITLEDAPLGGPRRLTLGGLLDDNSSNESPTALNSITINIDDYSSGTPSDSSITPTNTNSPPHSPLRSPRRVVIDTNTTEIKDNSNNDNNDNNSNNNNNNNNNSIANNISRPSFTTRLNKSLKPLETNFHKSDSSSFNNTSSRSSSYQATSPVTATPRAINAYVSNITNYYDIATPATPANNVIPSSSPASPDLPSFPSSPSSPTSSHVPTTPFSDSRTTPFGSRHNSEGNLSTTKLFKHKYLLEFNNEDLEYEYLAETRALLITQQKAVALLVAFCLLVDSLLKGLVFLDSSTLKSSLGPPILFLILYTMLCIGKVRRRSQEVIAGFGVLIMISCFLDAHYHKPVDALETRSSFVFLTLYAVFRVKFKYSLIFSVATIVSIIIVNCILYFTAGGFTLGNLITSPLLTISVAMMGCFVGYLIEKKEREVLVQRYIMQIETKKLATHSKRDQSLLLSIFPRALLSELEKHHFRKKYLAQDSMHQSQHGFNQLAHFYHSYPDVSILIADVVGFTALSSTKSPRDIVSTLNMVFEAFDELCCKFGLEKIRTIGDAYLCVGNMTTPLAQHQAHTLSLAWEMIQYIFRMRDRGYDINLRIGIDCGPVYGGVTGLSKWNYDIFGATLSMAEQMEQSGAPGGIQVSENFYQQVKDQDHSYSFNERVDGINKTYFVAAKLERTGSSGVFLNYIEENHQSLTFEQFESMLMNSSGIHILSDYKATADPITEAIIKTNYYKKLQSKTEAEVLKRSQARLSVRDFDENMLGYDVTKEALNEEMARFGRKVFPKFTPKYERQYQHKTASSRQIYTDLVTRCLLLVLLIWVVIDLTRIHEGSTNYLVWISHALACALASALLYFARSRYFLRSWGNTCVGIFIVLITIAIGIRRYAFIYQIYSHLRLEAFIFCGFSFYYYYVTSYFILSTITCLYIVMVTVIAVTALDGDIILYLSTRYIMIMLACFYASRAHNKNNRKEFLMTKLIKNETEHKQKAVSRSKLLLYNLFPSKIVSRLAICPTQIADYYPESTIVFINIAHFHDIEERAPPDVVMEFLNDVFVAFDTLSYACGVEKIKTINSKYMLASGIPTVRSDHALAAMNAVLRMFASIKKIKTPEGDPVVLRAGMASGPVVAGIIGKSKYSYDCWADAVNTAARMESLGQDGLIQVTEEVYLALKDKFTFTQRDPIAVKGKGIMTTYLLSPSDPKNQALQTNKKEK